MYEHFFGFSQKPFNVTPDPRHLFMTDSHQEALASLVYGIQERRGFISISGEIGTGKTTLLNYLQTILDPKVRTIFIFQTHITFEELLEQILRDLKVPIVDRNKISMTRKLKRFLLKAFERQENVAILIDEAQNLSNEVLEELRMLSNIETGEAKLFQMVLIGQPELEKKLNSEDLRQLKQRIGIRRQIRPLTEEETKQYIEQRLQKMGGKIEEIFSPEALDLICRYSGGVFRTINIICDNAFLIGYSLKKKKIDETIVREVLGDMGMMVPRESVQAKKVYSPESVIHSHYRSSSGEDRPEYSRPPQAARWLTFPRVLGILAFAFAIYFAWVYFLNPAQLPRAIGNLHPPAVQEPSKTPRISGKKVSSAADEPKKEPSLPFPAKGIAERKGIEKTKSSFEFPIPPLLDLKEASAGRIPSSPQPIPQKDSPSISRKVVEVPEGGTLYSLVEKYYPNSNPTIVDYFLESNPSINNIHLLLPKQKIIVPEIQEESLLLEPEAGIWKVHLGTFPSPESVKIYKEEESLRGKEIRVVERRVSPKDTWYRIYAENFASKEEGLKSISELKIKGRLPALKGKN